MLINFYESINEYYTVADTSASFSTTLNNNLRAVQSTSNIDLAVGMGTYSLTQWDSAIFKINNALPGLIPSIASPNDTNNYNYYYFKNINMILAQKKTLNNVTTVGIGSASATINYQSTFALSWVRILNSHNSPTNTNPYTLYYSTPSTLTLTTLTSYSGITLAPVEGYQSTGSTAMYSAIFNTPIVPNGGEIRLLFDNSVFSSNNIKPCRVASSTFGRPTNDKDVLRCYRVS